MGSTSGMSPLKDLGLQPETLTSPLQDVFDVFNRHPGMVLKRSDIAAWRVNWQPKSANLEELARELNLGLDTFVFVDDDAVNRVQVEMRLPQVHVLPLPTDRVLFADTLARCWLFDNPAEQTAEDAARTEMIQQEGHRRRFTKSAVSMDSYLAGLRLNVEMREAEPYDLARLAQLTQKTNQFNLSLRRRTVEGIKALGQFLSVVRAERPGPVRRLRANWLLHFASRRKSTIAGDRHVFVELPRVGARRGRRLLVRRGGSRSSRRCQRDRRATGRGAAQRASPGVLRQNQLSTPGLPIWASEPFPPRPRWS
jgi:hypothetical protein